MRFNILGPLEMVGTEGTVALGGVVQRSTLGYLLLHPNKVVATSRIVGALWGDEAPVTSRKMVQNAISGIRRMLAEHEGPDGRPRLDTANPGYMLHIDPQAVDSVRFRMLATRGRAELTAGLAEAASATLSEALGLWRDSVLVDLAEAGIRWPAFAQLDRERMAVYEDWATAELELGRHFELACELDRVAAAVPTRERLCRHLMLALYRCGRQSEALAVYRRTRRELVEVHGLDPSQELQALERSILNQEPRLLGRQPQLV